jgi:hypothetical protein
MHTRGGRDDRVDRVNGETCAAVADVSIAVTS